MTTLTQGIQTDEFLLSEANGTFSREQVTVTVAGNVALPSGTELGKITATSKYVKVNNSASDGSQTSVAILRTALPGVNGDYKATVYARTCEVSGAMLNGGAGPSSASELAAVGIIVR